MWKWLTDRNQDEREKRVEADTERTDASTKRTDATLVTLRLRLIERQRQEREKQ